MKRLVEFLLARIAEDEVVARGAMETPGAAHWHWVNGDTDEVITPDPFAGDPVTGSLRSVEELRTTSWGSNLPDFLIHMAEEVYPAAGLHITRHDPARVLDDCEARRGVVLDIEAYGNIPQAVKYDLLRQMAAPHAEHPDYQEAVK